MWWAPTSMKKIMTENGLFVLGRPDTQLHDILWAVHAGKNRGRSEGEENLTLDRIVADDRRSHQALQ